MKLSESELPGLCQSMTARRINQTGDCLDEDSLIRAALNDLTDAERANVVAHIATCSDCAREYRIARSLRFLEAEAGRQIGGSPIVREWWGIAAAIAVALMIPALVWLTVVQKRSEQTIENLRNELRSARQQPAAVPQEALIRPQLGTPIIDLDAGVLRGANPSVPSIVVPPTSEVFTIILHLPQAVRGPIELELLNSSRTVLWHDQVQSDSSTITLTFHRRLVPAGTYSIAAGSTTFRFRV